MASKLQQALGLSLDDYIAEKGIETGERPKPAVVPEAGEGAAFFKRQLRSEQEEEDDEDLLDMDDDPDGLPMDDCDEDEILGDTPPPLVPAVKFASGNEDDGAKQEKEGGEGEEVERTFITVEQQRGIRHMASQQWRLKRDDNVFKKPTGLQPLMSVRAEFDRNTDNLIASLGENAKFHNDESRARIQDRLGKLGRQNQNNGGRNNGGRFRNQNRMRNQFNGKPSVASFNPSRDRFQQQPQPNRGGPINDLRPLLTGPNPLAIDPFGGQIAAFEAALVQSSAQDQDKFSSAVQNAFRKHQLQQQGGQMQRPGLLGVAPSNCPQMAPFAAANVLLNHLTTVQQNFGPKYDMNIQKEIHELQGKKMLYGTNGVVSTDGPGIEDERIRPVATDLSMNMRFSSAVIEK
uniref:(northern house mosquito) hypothetical protein n=2 Tax=Culex pipiens TaxID=7175 RepID=A0A8D7ZVY7_CULPI